MDEFDKQEKNVIAFRKKEPRKKTLDWKITYEIHKKPTTRLSKDSLLFYAKLLAYLALVSFALKQCGYGM